MATYFDLCLEAPSPFDPSKDSLLRNATFTSLLRKASYLGYSVVAINSTLHLHSRSSPSKGSGDPFLHPLREPVPILQAKEVSISSLRKATKEKPREEIKRESLPKHDKKPSLMSEGCTGERIRSSNENAIPPSRLNEPSPYTQQVIPSSLSSFSSSSHPSPSSSLPLSSSSSSESIRRSSSPSSSFPPVNWLSPSTSPFHPYTTPSISSSSSSLPSSPPPPNFLYIPRGCSVTGPLSSMWGDLLPYAVSATSAQQYLSLPSLSSSSSSFHSRQASLISPSIASLDEVLFASSLYKAAHLQQASANKKKDKKNPSVILRKKEEKEEERKGGSLKNEEDIEMSYSEPKGSRAQSSEMNAAIQKKQQEEAMKNEESSRLLLLLPRSPDVQIDLLQLRRVTVVLHNVSAAANFSTLFPPNPPYYPSLSPGGASSLPASCIDVLAIQPTDDLTWQFACSSCECDLISIDFSVSSSSSITENANTKTSIKASQNALPHTQALAAALKEREEEREREENAGGEKKRFDMRSVGGGGEGDLLSLPRKLPFSIRRKHIQQAIRRGLYFEVNLSHFLSSSSSISCTTSSSSSPSSTQKIPTCSSLSPDGQTPVSPSSSSLISALSNLNQLLRYIPPSRLLLTSGARREEELLAPQIKSSLLAALRIGGMGPEGVRLSSDASRNLLARAAATRHSPGGACIGGWIGAGI